MELTVFHVDAFTNEVFGGNPAGVVLDSKHLTTEIMQKIANELNLSETAFIKYGGEDTYYIRYFTPITEVDLCGHATIASFYTLAKQEYIKPIDNGSKTVNLITNNLKLEIEIKYKDWEAIGVKMEQASPESYGFINEVNDIIAVSNLRGSDIGYEDELIKPEIISTGLKDIILPLKSREALDSLEFDMCGLRDLSEKLNVVGIHAFHLPNKNAKEVYVRNFAPLVGIDEEAATGTANGALIYYLKTHSLINGNKITAKQGEILKRPSEIHCSIEEVNGRNVVKVGGSANITIEGILKY